MIWPWRILTVRKFRHECGTTKTFTSDLECAFAALLPNKGSSPKIATTTALEAGATSPQSPASSNSVTGGPRERRSSLGLIHVFPLRGHRRRNNAALLLHVLYSSVKQEGPTTAARIRPHRGLASLGLPFEHDASCSEQDKCGRQYIGRSHERDDNAGADTGNSARFGGRQELQIYLGRERL